MTLREILSQSEASRLVRCLVSVLNLESRRKAARLVFESFVGLCPDDYQTPGRLEEKLRFLYEDRNFIESSENFLGHVIDTLRHCGAIEESHRVRSAFQRFFQRFGPDGGYSLRLIAADICLLGNVGDLDAALEGVERVITTS